MKKILLSAAILLTVAVLGFFYIITSYKLPDICLNASVYYRKADVKVYTGMNVFDFKNDVYFMYKNICEVIDKSILPRMNEGKIYATHAEGIVYGLRTMDCIVYMTLNDKTWIIDNVGSYVRNTSGKIIWWKSYEVDLKITDAGSLRIFLENEFAKITDEYITRCNKKHVIGVKP